MFVYVSVIHVCCCVSKTHLLERDRDVRAEIVRDRDVRAEIRIFLIKNNAHHHKHDHVMRQTIEKLELVEEKSE